MKPIEVSFPMARIKQIGHEVPANVEILAKLRNAGVPVIGNISVQTRIYTGAIEAVSRCETWVLALSRENT